MIMFRECLKNNIIPFIIDAKHKMFYYRGLKNYNSVHGYLEGTCLSAQDQYKEICTKFKIQLPDEQKQGKEAINELSEKQLKQSIRALIVAGK